MKTIEELKSALEKLSLPKEQAIREENYVLAAEIRDQQKDIIDQIESLEKNKKVKI